MTKKSMIPLFAISEFDDTDEDYLKKRRAYKKGMCADPKSKQKKKLDELSFCLNEDDVLEVNFDYYNERFNSLSDQMYRFYTGYGQCRGLLAIDGDRVILCCCKKMAHDLSYGGAHVHNEGLYMSNRKTEYVHEGDGSEYIIHDKKPRKTSFCPHCGTVLNVYTKTTVDLMDIE